MLYQTGRQRSELLEQQLQPLDHEASSKKQAVDALRSYQL
jgi:hypothetical protein